MASGMLRILIVDDEPTNLATLKQILSESYSLVFARSGMDCLTAAIKHSPALILLDVQMPDMDGYTVCRKLKANPETRNIPVIFVSALSEVGDEAAGFDSGGVDYIIKPVSPALVRARVRTHISLVHATALEIYIKQLEIERAKIAGLSRIHSLLSGINSAIVRIQEPHTLVEEACRIAVDKGSFGIAWITAVDRGTNDLSVWASQGVEPDALVSTLIPMKDDGSQNMDAPQQAATTGKAICCNDVLVDSHQERTFLDARSRGYRSVVALPLALTETVTGAMVLYARTPNFFDNEELKLLNELAGDISFALRSIDNKKRAHFLSYYDSLTELPNTTLFLDRLEQLMQSAQQKHNSVFVIALNLNQFKQINDLYGRHIGDEILKVTAERLDCELAHSYSVTRIGADNFALMGEQAEHEDVGDCCKDIVSLLSLPISIQDQDLEVSVRMGVSLFPTDAKDGESLLKNAEMAMKQVHSVKSPYIFYSPELNARIKAKASLDTMLRSALNNQEFVLHFQPKVDLESGAIIGAEALIRWIHPERRLVPPMEFIPLAEENGLIVPIGEWVIDSVCVQQSAWLRDGMPTVPIALNLSAMQFREGNILMTLGDALEGHKIAPKWLELEVTETMVMQNPSSTEKTLRAIRDLGLHLALDDFGTGYSSLAYLKRFPFNTVKIDRTFITDIVEDPDDAAIAFAIIAMSHSLNMTVVAEGVETEAQLNILRSRSCDQAQGYYFSRPVPSNDFQSMLIAGKHLELGRTKYRLN